ncbi:DEAD/DEAH box helicase [Halomarina oriensis]|uniref:DEAD/DEAH box helicase n=1 Tax=Halomarina oriensis TaxID=671145 RepID=A0A6B0GIR1_9EURY|nr:DEAD/DEAH box helicase [Halomarina oriensis]MWG34766.1 DEAD/DEAH box helicase [Halomarina oriensis]
MAASSESDTELIDGPLLTPGLLQRREYQVELAEAALRDHTLVCLPTGLGKTAVSLLVTAQRLHEAGGKALFLAPTKPLVNQHADFYREALTVPDDDIVVFTGEVRPDDRAELWDSARVVIATPQVVENDLVGNRISLRDVTHLTFDECHRATGDYAYCYIAERYHEDAENPLVTGMSASPGGDKEEILIVSENLGLREVAVMTEGDSDVSEFTHKTEVEWERVELPETVIEIRDALNEVITDRLEKLKQLGVTRSTNPEMSQRDLNSIRSELQQMMSNDQSEGYQGMSAHAEIMKLRRAVELVETQSVESLRRYFERQRNAARSSGASKASQRFVSEPRVQEAMRRAEAFDDLHPKFRRARILLAQTLGIENGERVIVFTESRDTAETLTDFFGNHFSTHKFVGQGDKEGSDGMTQKQQQETLDAFRRGEFEVLVSTSVAEEGLDVPEVDLVLFYEPVPKGIRAIQRKGRTGRQTEGKVHVLLAEDTRDEAYFWISRREEKRMAEELNDLKNAADEVNEELGQHGLDDFEDATEQSNADATAGDAATNGGADTSGESDGTADTKPNDRVGASTGNGGGTDGQSGLDSFAGTTDGADDADAPTADGPDDGGDGRDGGSERDDDAPVATARGDGETVEIVVDQRELDATIARDLSTRDGITTRLETLAVGDYVLSDRVVVERKSVDDFLDTLVGGDRSMFEQVKDAARHYSRPVVVVEGEDLYGARNVHPNAIRGALASLAVDFGASILRTTDETDTADLVEVIARREQEESKRSVSVHGEKAAKTLTEQQEYVVGSIADVGPVTARSLLEHFGSVEAVMTASEDDLLEVAGVGAVTAERIREVVGSDYE